MTRTFYTLIKHFSQGLLMGGADIIPGVSGGTMALIVGIYERLVASISFLFSAVLALVKLDITEARIHFKKVAWTLILPLGAGIGSALVVGARIIPYFLEHYPSQSLGLFFGLVAASLAIPWRRISNHTASAVVVALLAAALAFWLAGFPANDGITPSLFAVFGFAAVAICAMILPGVSGAFLLKVLGVYESTLTAVNEHNYLYIIVFMAGAAIGLGIFSKVLNWLIEHYHDKTMAALVGLMAGALRALWPWQDVNRTLLVPSEGDPVASVIVVGILGFIFVTALSLWSREKPGRSGEITE